MKKLLMIAAILALHIQLAQAQETNKVEKTEEKDVLATQTVNPSAQIYKGSFAARKAAFKKNVEVRRQQIAERKKQVEEEEKRREELLARLAAEKAAAEEKAKQEAALKEDSYDEIQVRPIVEQSDSAYAPNEEKVEEKSAEEIPEVEVNSSDELLKEIETLRKTVERLNKSGDELVKDTEAK